MPRYRVRRRIEQETIVLADNEHDAENIAQSFHELEWEDTGYVELKAEYDFRKAPEMPEARSKEQLN